ncbi:MAG: DUF58 domain-containing protein [Propionibacterium sp.]|nr:DUF58 domain-containing protein [Propionibacterium sp.]
MSPAPSLTRAWWFALLLGVPAVLFGRPDLLVLAVPFVVHVAWAWARRPAPVDEPVTGPRTAALAEGDAALLTVRTGHPGAFTAVQFDGGRRMDFHPAHGTAVSADGEVVVAATPDRWGRYRLAPPVVAVTDASGAWRDVVEGDEVVLTVRPDVQRLQGGTGVTRPVGISGIHRSRDRGDGTDLADIREFVPGDRLKRINWRVSSRTGSLHVNSMFVERDTDVLIVVDTLTEYSSGLREASTSLDQIARALTAITAHYVAFGDRVAIHDLGGRIRSLRGGSGPRQAQAVLSALALTDRGGQEERTFRRVPHVGGGTLVFFLSPLLDAPVRDELVRVRQLGGEVVGVDTLPEELGRTAGIKDYRPDTFLGEAWVLRRLERDDALARMQELGIPVTPWRGPGSLASVLRAMEAARSAPRIA